VYTSYLTLANHHSNALYRHSSATNTPLSLDSLVVNEDIITEPTSIESSSSEDLSYIYPSNGFEEAFLDSLPVIYRIFTL
jgi:hypothetical protein